MEREILPGLRVDVDRLPDELGHDPGEPFLLAGLALLERAVADARDDRWWSSLPDRLYRHLELECERALRVIRLGARLQAEHSEHLYELTHGEPRSGYPVRED